MFIGVLAVALLTLTVISQITAAAAAAAWRHDCNDIATSASRHNVLHRDVTHTNIAHVISN